MAKARRDYLNALLAQTKGNVREAAKLADINKSVLYKYLAMGQCEKPLGYRRRRVHRGNQQWQQLGY